MPWRRGDMLCGCRRRWFVVSARDLRDRNLARPPPIPSLPLHAALFGLARNNHLFVCTCTHILASYSRITHKHTHTQNTHNLSNASKFLHYWYPTTARPTHGPWSQPAGGFVGLAVVPVGVPVPPPLHHSVDGCGQACKEGQCPEPQRRRHVRGLVVW